MKRAPFKRSDGKARLTVPARQWTADELPGARVPVVVPQMDAPITPQPKREYIRSRALLDACGQIECQRCGKWGAVGAHSNWAIHGKGRSIKADDNRIAALCSYCHRDIDQGGALNERGKQRIWWAAHVRTVKAMIELGLWPLGVPVPDLTMPKEWE